MATTNSTLPIDIIIAANVESIGWIVEELKLVFNSESKFDCDIVVFNMGKSLSIAPDEWYVALFISSFVQEGYYRSAMGFASYC